MKITFLLPPVDLSGGNRVISLHAKWLQERSHEVTLVTTPPAPPRWREQVRSMLKGQGWINRPRVSASHFDGLPIRLKVLEKARAIGPQDVPDADVVIATWWETAEWVQQLPPQKGAKVHFIQGHELFDYLPIDRVAGTWRLPLHKIVVSQWLADIARDRYGAELADLVPNAVDCEQFHAPLRDKQVRPTVGMLYSPMQCKGADLALQAIELARRQLPELAVVALGSHPQSSELALPSDARYFRSPAQDKIREVYAQCDAWLFASRSEGFGLPIVEAMACRTPVIGVPAGAAPELLGDGAGRLVQAENPQDMARAIVEVCTMASQQWRELSRRAHERVSTYTWDDASRLFEASLHRAAAAR
jgi:glycosyltransferase involved in cell wall biosynthesis